MSSVVSTVELERLIQESNTNTNTSCLLNLKRRHDDHEEQDKVFDFQQQQQQQQQLQPREEEEVNSVTRSSQQPFGSWSEPLVSTNQTEFFDADDEFLSDGSLSNASPSFLPNIEAELHAARDTLLNEIERGQRAENAIAQVSSQWQRIKNHLSRAGLSFPAVLDCRKDPELDVDAVQQFCEEVVAARVISEAVGRGEGRAEAEAAAEIMMEAKDQEISRLRNKVNYYEAVNHEMSRRNQEVIDIVRKQRLTRKTRQRWIWTCVGLSVTFGAFALAYKHFPQTTECISSETSDASSDLPETV